MKRPWLLAAPLPIIAASIALATWAKNDPNAGATRNEIAPSEIVWVSYEEEYVELEAIVASCAATAERLDRSLGADFSVVTHAPFVLAGDLSEDALEKRYREAILPAFIAMRESYFDRPADEPITILLFTSEMKYRTYAQRLFAQSGMSIYGFYKPSHRTMLINLDAGEGTIVHELTHALIEFDFPEVPLWFNEGLASLHEHCRFGYDDTGQRRIEGLDNWRLSVLHQAIRQQRVPPVTELMCAEEFYGRNEAINYAQARYFCMYLQQRGLLGDYYAALRDDAGLVDGVGALARILPDRSASEFDTEFQDWVLGRSATGHISAK